MNANDLSILLCKDLVRRVAQRAERTFIVTQFQYPDGDFVNVYLERQGGQAVLSDLGTTLFKCSISGVKLTPSRDDLIRGICNRHGVALRGNTLTRAVCGDTAGTDVLAFCEAICRVSNLEYETVARRNSAMREQLDALLDAEVAPKRHVARNWTHPGLDPKQSFPVDYRLNGSEPAVHIFHVGSGGKSTLVAAVANFLLAHGVSAPTLSIVDPDIRPALSSHQLDRLQRALTDIVFGIGENAPVIVEFALYGRRPMFTPM